MKYQLMEYAGVTLIACGIAAFSIAAAVAAVGVYLFVSAVLEQMGDRNDS